MKILLWGIFIAISFPYVLMGLLFLLFHPKVEVAWYDKGYYLQQEVCFSDETGYGLYVSIMDELQLILPHVYGYEKEKNFIYIAANQGYGVINRKDRTADIVLFSEKIPKIDANTIRYYTDLSAFSVVQQEKLQMIPHELLTYEISSGKDGGDTPVGDGRFRYTYARVGEEKYRILYVYGLYGNFDEQDTLLDDVTGYSIEKTNGAETMYVTSSYGYAVVDGPSSTCRVYFTNPDLAGKDYQEDIRVLNSYEDFTPEERAILEEVERKGLP